MGLTGCTGFQPFSAPFEGSIRLSIPLLTGLRIHLSSRLNGSADGHARALLLCRLSTHCLHVIIFGFCDHQIHRGVQIIIIHQGFDRNICKTARAQWLPASMLCPFSPTLWKSQQNRKLHNKQLKTVISKLYNEGVQTDVLPQ